MEQKSHTRNGPAARSGCDEEVITPPLVVENVAAGYGSNIVVKDVSFTVRPGETVAVVGSSGCGKSTLLKTLVGLLPPASGRVTLLGCDLWSMPVDARRELLHRVGLIFQGGALLGSMTVKENLGLPLEMHTRLSDEVIARLVDARLSQVGLSEFAHLKPAELSGGMRKRVAVARSLMLDPDLLLCDEPTSGLDPVVAAGIDELLVNVRELQENALLVVSHDLASIRRLGARILMMARGHLVAEGSYDELAVSNDPEVRRFFNRQARPSGEGGALLTDLIRTQPKS
jgi:phospholipid/cholesterol/gamma-HCH transport system ATP-binding protein